MTLYVIPNDSPEKANSRRLIDSLRGFIDEATLVGNRKFNEIEETKNEWFCIMYDNEYLDERLRESLLTFLDSSMPFDFLTLYKRVHFVKRKEGGGLQKEAKLYTGPRIFRKGTKLVDGDFIMPVDAEKLNGQIILNGWVLEDDRYENSNM
jgi:hypothetical protein